MILLHFCCISVVFAVVLFILRHLVYEVACSVLEHSVSIRDNFNDKMHVFFCIPEVCFCSNAYACRVCSQLCCNLSKTP